MEKKCLVCYHPIKGRKDKIFCSDYCRSYYHNQRNKDNLMVVQKINKILKKNRQILENALDSDVFELDVDTITKLGFTLDFYTQIKKSTRGNWNFFIYDLGIQLVDNGSKMKILKVKKFNFPK